MSRPQNFESNALRMRTCLTYFVSRGSLNGAIDFVEIEPDGATAAQPHALRRAVEISRRDAPLLPFAAIHRQLDGVAGGEMEGLVLVQQRLNGVVAGRQPRQRFDRIAEHAVVERALVTGLQAFDVDAEYLRRRRARGGDLKPGLALVVPGDEHQQPAVQRLAARVRAEPDGDRGGRLRRRRGLRGEDRYAGQQQGTEETCLHATHPHLQAGSIAGVRC